jgi:hypothetical protein
MTLWQMAPRCLIIKMATFNSLPNELAERILLKVATDDDSVPQDLCSAEIVCKDWKELARESCWQALLEKQLGMATACKWDEAAWLIHRLQKCKDTLSASSAKRIFKLHGTDLRVMKPATVIVRRRNARYILLQRYNKAGLVRATLQKYGSVDLFREHVWKCGAMAAKRAKTAFQRGVDRQRQVDEVLEEFDEGVLGIIANAIECFVARNLGTLEGLYRRAINVLERRDAIAALLLAHDIKIEQVPFCVRSIQWYEEGCLERGRVVDELARHVALNEGLKARGILLGTYSTSISFCRRYVTAGGDLSPLLDNVELHEFYRAEMGCLDGDNRHRALSRWMRGMARVEVLKKAPVSLQNTSEFQECFFKRFPAAG